MSSLLDASRLHPCDVRVRFVDERALEGVGEDSRDQEVSREHGDTISYRRIG